MRDNKAALLAAAAIVRDAGGQIIGRTKLQKVAYFLELSGLGEGFSFSYRHYGPYSEDLAEATELAEAFGLITELEKPSTWGGAYSVYSAAPDAGPQERGVRSQFAEEAAKIDSVDLELAATAAYLAVVEGYSDPWEETVRRKPEKANSTRLRAAQDAYRRLSNIRTPKPLPAIVP